MSNYKPKSTPYKHFIPQGWAQAKALLSVHPKASTEPAPWARLPHCYLPARSRARSQADAGSKQPTPSGSKIKFLQSWRWQRGQNLPGLDTKQFMPYGSRWTPQSPWSPGRCQPVREHCWAQCRMRTSPPALPANWAWSPAQWTCQRDISQEHTRAALIIRHRFQHQVWLLETTVARETINTYFHITDNSANENGRGQMVMRIHDKSRKLGNPTVWAFSSEIIWNHFTK